jgi:hypothetical protein
VVFSSTQGEPCFSGLDFGNALAPSKAISGATLSANVSNGNLKDNEMAKSDQKVTFMDTL